MEMCPRDFIPVAQAVAGNVQKLTSLLHIKEDTNNITVNNLEVIYKDILKDKNDLTLSSPEKIVVNLVYETADIILLSTDEIIELENKIVLAIAIRLKAEQFMVVKINDNVFWRNITKYQTSTLIERFKKDFPAAIERIDILEQVNLMTPEKYSS